jgi:hypothetical protein
MNKEMTRLFEKVFNEMPDERLDLVVEKYSSEVVTDILRYYLINGIHPPAEGKRTNPYGLLYKVGQNWKL